MDPYKVLGISSDATDAEVKKAYRALAKKYHPDNYVNNPLADLAAEKMKQINEAYDEIQKQRAAGLSSGLVGGRRRRRFLWRQRRAERGIYPCARTNQRRPLLRGRGAARP